MPRPRRARPRPSIVSGAAPQHRRTVLLVLLQRRFRLVDRCRPGRRRTGRRSARCRCPDEQRQGVALDELSVVVDAAGVDEGAASRPPSRPRSSPWRRPGWPARWASTRPPSSVDGVASAEADEESLAAGSAGAASRRNRTPSGRPAPARGPAGGRARDGWSTCPEYRSPGGCTVFVATPPVGCRHMSTTPARVYAARLVGLPIFDPQGDQVGKVRDLVVAVRSEVQPAAGARAGGRGLRPAPDLRADDPGDQHRQRAGLHDRPAQHAPLRAAPDRDPGDRPDARPHRHRSPSTGVSGTVYDVAMEQARNRDWVLSRVAVQEPTKGLRRRGQTHVVEWRDVEGLTRREESQGATHLIAALNEMRPADAANMIHDLPARAADRGRRRARRRAARRRPRGAARGGPGRDPRAPRLRARRRRPRGDVARRRRRPDRRPAARDRRDPARADGARGGRGRPPADVVRREHRRRDDDARAGDPRARTRPSPTRSPTCATPS